MGVKLLNEQLSRLEGFKFQQPFNQAGIQGQIYVSQVRTLNYQPPQWTSLSFEAPSYLVFDVKNMAIR